MINDRLIWIKQICAEVEALRKGVGVSYVNGRDPLAQLREEWERGSYTEGDEYPEYSAPLLEQLEFLTLRYEGYAYTSQVLEAAANAIRSHRRNQTVEGADMKPVFIVFDGPPSRDSGRFVEVETADGKSVSAGEWKQDGEYWNLGPFYTADQLREAQVKVLREAADAISKGMPPNKAREMIRRMADELEKQG